MKPTRIAVTGPTGQVGAALVRRLHEEGWHVVAAARNALGAALVHAAVPDCDIRVGPLARTDGKHVLDDCDVIVNAALASSGGNPRAAYTRNRELVDGLLQARALRWLVHFSTVAIYGELIRPYRDERTAFEQPRPGSEYGRSKLDVERYTVRRAHELGIPATVLRLGHVYGPEIGRSREIIELARDSEFRLPYDGRFPSNAIHVERLADAIVALVQRGPQTALFSFAERDSTWRDVFDWHTNALGMPPVRGMDDADSDRARDVWARASVPRELVAWLRSLPVKRLVRSPAMFDLALRILVRTPGAITRRVTSVNRRVGARGNVAAALGSGPRVIPPLYLSAGIPGPFLDLAAVPATGRSSAAGRALGLREWFAGWSRPFLGEGPEQNGAGRDAAFAEAGGSRQP